MLDLVFRTSSTMETPLSCSFGAADKGASCCGVHSEGNPSDPFVLGLLGLKLKGIRRALRLTAVTVAVPFGIAVVLLWVKYERYVNDSVDGGVFR